MKVVIKRDYAISGWTGVQALCSYVITEAPDESIVGDVLCPDGVHKHFKIRKSAKPVELIFSKGKPRGEEGEQSCKMTFEQELDEDGDSYPWVGDEVTSMNYDLFLDGQDTGLDTDEEDMVFDLWEQGYNYVRAEIIG